MMGSHVLRMVTAVVVTGLLHHSSVYASFDGFDGRPRPDGMLDAPTKKYGPKPAATYQGQPATTCIWFSWESYYYDPKDTKDCSKELWNLVKKLSPLDQHAFQYYTLDTFPQNAYCTIGCFDLSSPVFPQSPPFVDSQPPPVVDVQPPPFVDSQPPPVVDVQPPPFVDTQPPPVVAAQPPPVVDVQPPPFGDAQPPSPAEAHPPPRVDAQPPSPAEAHPPPRVDAQPPSPAKAQPPAGPLVDAQPPPLLPPSESDPPSATASSALGPVIAPREPSSGSRIGLIAGVCSAGFGAVLVGLLAFCCVKRRKEVGARRFQDDSASDRYCVSGLATDVISRPYTFKELCVMTNNFADSELLSSGSFGEVFRGTQISAGGSRKLVAVKRIRRQKEFGQASFIAEANSLRRICHRNLLQLRGWCDVKEGMFLVYDFMSNGSVDKWLHTDDPASSDGHPGATLPWSVRRSVLAGVAEGLQYLHEGCVQCVLHRDIKSSNVMLDENFTAHLGDFGLARLVDHDKMQRTTVVAGTLGYMAPEMFHTGRATKESDVYAFGILVLEVVCGRSPFATAMQSVDAPEDHVLVDRVWRAHEAGRISHMLDPRLDQSLDHQMTTTIINVLQLGLLCCLPNPSDRPSIRLVSHWFQSLDAGAVLDQFPHLPAFQPAPPARYISVPPLSSTEGSSSSHDSMDTSPSGAQTSTTTWLMSNNR